eukprot:gene9011-9184_t
MASPGEAGPAAAPAAGPAAGSTVRMGCRGPGIQKAVAGAVLGLQLLRMVLGSAGLATLAALPLAVTLLDDRTAVELMQRLSKAVDHYLEVIRQQLVQCGLLKGPAEEVPELGGASAELLEYKPKGLRQRRFSNDSLASMLTVPDPSEQLVEVSDSSAGQLSWKVWAAAAAAFSTTVLALEMFPVQLAAFLLATAGTADEVPKPSGKRGRVASTGKAPSGTPTRKGASRSRGAAGAFAAALAEEQDGQPKQQQQQHQEEEQEHSDATTQVPAAKGKRAAASRAKKLAAAAVNAADEGTDSSSGVSSGLVAYWGDGAPSGCEQAVGDSYLAYEFATSSDGMTWQAVRFRGGLGSGQGFGFQGLTEQLMLGRLAAAGVTEMSDDMWLLHVADMLLEGDAILGSVLEQPVLAHDWVRLDLVRYSPSSLLPADSGLQGPPAAAPGAAWQVQHVEELLPAFPRGDPDLKEALAALGLTRNSINRAIVDQL